MPLLFGDTETFATLDLKAAGPYRYTEDPALEILLFPYAIDDGPVRLWEPGIEPMPADLRSHLEDPNTLRIFHNVMFDRQVLAAKDLGAPIERYRDTMVLAYMAGLPGNMEDLGTALGFSEEEAKLKEGNKLIQRFCKPAPKNHKAARYDRTTHPEEWERFREYAKRDVETMRRIWHLLPNWNYNGRELELWYLDQRINDRGLPIDPAAVEAAIALAEETVASLDEEMKDLTGGAVGSAREVAALHEWLSGQGYPLHDMKAGTVEWALDGKAPWGDPPAHVRRALSLRQQVSKTSAAKYRTLVRAASSDNRMRGVLQFYGAFRTGRWAGRRFQPQNLPRPTIPDTISGMEAMLNGTVDVLYAESPMEVVSSCIRAAIAAPSMWQLVPGDLSNIEGRVLAWLAHETWKLRAFRDFDRGVGPDLYKVAYSNAFGVPVADVTKANRQIGKVMELALGYQGAVGAFNSMADNYGVDLPDETVVELVKAWRQLHPAIKGFWYETEDAAIRAVNEPGREVRCRRVLWKCTTHNGYSWLLARLPSGRVLCYFEPRVRTVSTDYGEKPQLSYMGYHTYTHKWTRVPTYGGKLVENLTQATARDILAEGMPRIEAAGYPIIGTVHDEVIAEAPASDPGAASEIERLMAVNPSWAEGLPLAVEAETQARYAKSA